jgi:uncharacterized protein YerC
VTTLSAVDSRIAIHAAKRLTERSGGSTLMTATGAVMRSEDGRFHPGYMTVGHADALSAATVGRVLRMLHTRAMVLDSVERSSGTSVGMLSRVAESIRRVRTANVFSALAQRDPPRCTF